MIVIMKMFLVVVVVNISLNYDSILNKMNADTGNHFEMARANVSIPLG